MSGYLCAPNGARPEVAYERGCEWDPISFHWDRRERVEDPDNQELIRGFLEAGPWHRFYDAEGTVEVDPADRVLTTLWLTKREHVVHCMYTLRQTHLWLAKGFDPPFNYSHTIHCTSYLVNIILESPVPDMDKLTVHAVPYPADWQVKEAAGGDAPAYSRLDDDENGNGSVVSKEELGRLSINRSVATMLSFFALGFLVAMTTSATIVFFVPAGMYAGLEYAGSS
ncbi:hypothetical protein CSHISOI_09889 [Colletotrichum shisoi]|uniref:Uncharacterized protein n=1 Tax=Colletotrichum shisoi TaxID=2078593 RepID=A0A5Q4BFW9_9PEZI|nr:hypothetical protein CSHISOI_09889 [Colletotrichum shisoi]